MIITERDGMRKTAKKSRARVITDTGIFCVAVIFMFFSVVLFVQEFDYVPQEVYNDPPPAAPRSETIPPISPGTSPAPSFTPPPLPTQIPSVSPFTTAGSTPIPSPTGNTETATPKPTGTSTPKPTATQAPSQNGWVQSGPSWYYYKNGAMVKGWLKSGGKWYYLGSDGKMVTNKTIVIKGVSYTFDKNGVWQEAA